jgi:hypothetical protein
VVLEKKLATVTKPNMTTKQNSKMQRGANAL